MNKSGNSENKIHVEAIPSNNNFKSQQKIDFSIF